ncbi:hypothetical protein Tco_1225424 [Tanacetum coccineum]
MLTILSIFRVWSISQILSKEYPPGDFNDVLLGIEPKGEEFSGEYFVDNNVAKVSGYGKDAELAKKLWEYGMKLTALK